MWAWCRWEECEHMRKIRSEMSTQCCKQIIFSDNVWCDKNSDPLIISVSVDSLGNFMNIWCSYTGVRLRSYLWWMWWWLGIHHLETIIKNNIWNVQYSSIKVWTLILNKLYCPSILQLLNNSLFKITVENKCQAISISYIFHNKI